MPACSDQHKYSSGCLWAAHSSPRLTHQIDPSWLYSLGPAGVTVSHCFTGLTSLTWFPSVIFQFTVRLHAAEFPSPQNSEMTEAIAFTLPGIEKVTHLFWSPRRHRVTRREQQGRPWHRFRLFFSTAHVSCQISTKPSLTSTFFRIRFLEFLCI